MKSRKSWPLLRKNSALIIAVLLAVMMTACAGGNPTEIPPTQALIPAVPTDTPIVPTITPTRAAVLLPSDLQTDVPGSLATLQQPDELAIARRAYDDLANAITGSIRLAHMESVIWRNADLECDSANTDTLTSGYRLIFVSGGMVYQYHTDEAEQARLCDVSEIHTVDSETLILVDPVAAEMLDLAQRRLAEEFDLSTRRVLLVEASAVTWPDTSLGCPVEDQIYTPTPIEGYRIVVSVAEQEYVFHTNFQRPFLCEIGDIPTPTPQPTAEVDPPDA